MKVGLGLYRHMLTRENFRFAKQIGATHIVAHWVNYFGKDASAAAPIHTGDDWEPWGVSDNHGKLWTYEELSDLKRAINEEGLELAAIENLDPSHWYDVLLDGPQKTKQIEDIKTTIRVLGKVGIPVLGYNFSVAGIWGRTSGPYGRGDSQSVEFQATEETATRPVPKGQVWNMIYDPKAQEGNIGSIGSEEMWQRLGYFLKEVVPVAEEAGVRLAAHPDDPPVPVLRGTARLIHQPRLYQRLLDIYPSHNNALEFCQGVLAEMSEGDIYSYIDKYSKQGNVAYVHFRNVRGKVPHYREVFVDEGDTDMIRSLKIYRKNGYEGVFVPDHSPQVACQAPWHASMAYVVGYLRGAIAALESND